MGTTTEVSGDDGGWWRLPSSQARLCFLHLLNPSDPAYNVGLAVELRGVVNPHRLAAVLSGIDRRHAALRSRFGVRSGTAVGIVDVPARVELPVVVLYDGQDVSAVLDAFARRPFDLSSGRPYRWCLMTVGADVHVLALVVHHIVFDGNSVAPLVSDLEALARSSASGVPAPAVPALPGDRPAGATPDTTRDRDYWRSALADLPPSADVWYARGIEGGVAVLGVPVARWTLQPTSLQSARELARRHRSTVPTVLLACLGVVLHRYTGHPDAVIGVPVDLDDGSQSIGHRVNLLPLRLRIKRQQSFDALLAVTRNALLEALDHRHTPFEQIVEVSGAFRRPGVAPLFQVLLTTLASQPPPRFDGMDTRLLRVPTPAAKYDLEITVTEGDGRAELLFEADPDSCSPVQLEEFAAHLKNVVQAALSDPRTPVARLAAGGRPGQRPALVRRRATRGTLPTIRDRGIFEVVRSAARIFPDRTAIRAIDGQLSYAALDRQSGLVAHALQRVGAAPEQVVAVCVPRGLSLPIAILGAARTGAAPLLLDPEQPDERLQAVLRDSNAIALVGSEAVLARCSFKRPTVCIEQGRVQGPGVHDPRIEGLSDREQRQVRGHPEQAAYVLATSGSSGRPKFVVLRRGGFGALLDWTRTAYDSGELAEVVALTSASFDLSVFEFFASLSTGGTVALVRSPGDLVGHAALHHATLLNTVPSVLDTLLDLDLVPTTAVCVNVAGEPLEERLVARLLDRRPSAKIRNLYGPTEATTYVTATEPLGRGGTPTIGSGIAEARLYVTDEEAAAVPTGVIGELRIGGPPLARGYLGAPGLTARSFVPDPAALDGSRLYRSGDVVRATGTGALHFLGRRDDQVKILGVRVEPGDIQAHLRAHPAVQEAVVIVVGKGRERRLVGCVGAGGEALTLREADLAAWLRTRLPEAMTPRQWIVLDRLPLTSNGKIDRLHLARLPVTIARTEMVPPRSELEAIIARCWHSVLARGDIGVHDAFFDAGGNSLTLLLLHDALQQQTNCGIRLVDLFRNPTIATQAGMVEQRRRSGDATDPRATGVSDGAARGAATPADQDPTSGKGVIVEVAR